MKLLSAKAVILCVVMAFMFAFVYRICAQHSEMARQACSLAIWLSVFAGIMGLIPAAMVIDSGTFAFFMAFLAGAVLRVIITIAGILAVITLVAPDRTWFLSITGTFYIIILVVETAFGVKVLRKLQMKDQEIARKDEPVVSEYEST
jgi:hypothetical protein